MSRQISFLFFVAAVVLVGIFFFQVIRPFLLPLLLAGILAVLFRPVYEQTARGFRGHRWVAAGVTTVLVLGAVILPVALILLLAVQELIAFGGNIAAGLSGDATPETVRAVRELRDVLTEEEYERLLAGVADEERPTEILPAPEDPLAYDALRRLEQNRSRDELRHAVEGVSPSELLDPESSPLFPKLWESLEPYIPRQYLEPLRNELSTALRRIANDLIARTGEFVADLASFVIGFAVMALALFYFLHDGPAASERIRRLLPMEDKDAEALVLDFGQVCRAVVLGMFLAAFSQAVLAGVAFQIAGLGNVWLLTLVTFVLSLLPIIGAAGVYVPVAIYLMLQGRVGMGVFVLIWGGALVSTSDNLIRAYTVQGRTHLHPLVALVSVLGAVKVIGLWGIFVGPIVAAFFYTLLKLLHDKIERMDSEPASAAGGPR